MPGHLTSVVLAACLLATAGCGSSPTQTQTKTTTEGGLTPTSAGTVFALIDDTPNLSTLASGIGAAGLVDRLEAEGPYTVFAPTNAAWAKLGTDRVEALMTNESKNLRQGLLNHIILIRLASTDLKDGQKYQSAGGPVLWITKRGTTITVNGARVIAADQPAGNGVVHIVDRVIR